MEDQAKSYAAPYAISWFRAAEQTNPTREEFIKKVAEFMHNFEDSLSTFLFTPMSEELKGNKDERESS
jgi:hypothetical protein